MEACGTASERGGSQYDPDGEEPCDFLIKHVTTTTIDGEEEENNVVMSKETTYKRGPWTKAEDEVLRKVVGELGSNDWVKIEMQSGLNRTSKSCRLRWKNHLQPSLKKGSFSFEEERDVIKMHYRFGNKWSLMAKQIHGRSDNEIKNFWHSRIKKCKKRGLPLYPDWCLKEDQTLNENDICMKSDVETTWVPNSTCQSHVSLLEQPSSVLLNHDMFQYYPPSTSETSMINASCSMTSPRTKFCLQGDCCQTALHHVSSLPGLNSFNKFTHAPLSPMDLSPRQLCPSFQHFLSPRPKTSQSFTFSTAISSTPAQLCSPYERCCSSPQLSYKKPQTDMSLRDSNTSIFETSIAPPVLSLPSGRFKRNPGATSELPPSIKLKEVPNYDQFQCIPNFVVSDSSFHMSALTHASSAPNLLNMHSPISPLSLSKSSKVSMLPTNQSNKSTMTIAPSSLELNSQHLYQTATLHSFCPRSFSSSPNLELEPLALQSLDQHASVNSTTKDSSSCTWKPSTSLEPCPYESLEPPSIQSHARELLPTSEMNYDSNESMSENYTDLLDTLLQDVQTDSCLSDLQLVEQYLFSQQLNTQHLYRKILRRNQYKNINATNKGISSSSNLSREVYSNGSLKSMDLLCKSQQGEVQNRTSTCTQEVKDNYSNKEVQGSGDLTTNKLLQWEISRNGSSSCSSNMENLLHENIEMNVSCINFIKQALVRTSNDKGPPSEFFEVNDPLREHGKRKLKMADQSFIEMSSIESLSKESLKRGKTMPKCENYSSILNIESDQTSSADIIVGQNLKDEELVTSGQHVSSSGELGNQNETCHTTSDSWNELLNTKYSGDDCFIKNIKAYENTIPNNDLGDATTETLLLDSQDHLHGSSLCYLY